ncbi:hypothetical protein MD484_g6818, partial [Candolleomyces efflorescens]
MGNLNYSSGNQYVLTNDQATLLQLLQPILDASHTRDRQSSPPNSACFPGTRVEVIKSIVAWAESTLLWNTHVLWLYGFVGCGKSAIALAIALKFERRNRLVGSFFFFRNTGDRSKMTRFATTLAFQLAIAIPEAAPFIRKAVTDGGLRGLSLTAQLRRLVYEPFKSATKQVGAFKTFFKPFLVVIDGLDECEDREEVRAFIDDMLLFFQKNPLVPLRFLITSRVEQHIEGHLKNGQVRLEDLVDHCSRNDLEAFMNTCFEEEKKRNPVIRAYIQEHGDWPTKEDKATLVDHIGGSFVFASTLFKYIIDPTDSQSTPMERLPHTLKMNPGLDILYARTLSRSQHLPYFHEVISTLALLFEPLPIIGIAELLGIKTFEVVRVLVNLQAIIHIPGTDNLPVTICHTSLRDFLTTESRSGIFFTSPRFHLHLSHRCSIPREHQPDTAITQYTGSRCKDHFSTFISLPRATQDASHHEMLDSIYSHFLAKSENLPHFSDIIATIAPSQTNPPSITEISNLLSIHNYRVQDVLANLKPIISIPRALDAHIIVRQADFFQFLTDQGRSGRFFIPPSHHLKLSYYHFNFSLELWRTVAGPDKKIIRGQALSHSHWLQLGAVSGPELTRLSLDLLSHPPSLSQYLFLFTRHFLRLFEDGHSSITSQEAPDIIVECLSALVLAFECSHKSTLWTHWRFNRVEGSKMKTFFKTRLRIHCEQAMAMQGSVQRVEKAIQSGWQVRPL